MSEARVAKELWATASQYAREAYEGTRTGAEAVTAYQEAREADPYGQYPDEQARQHRAQGH